MDTLRGVFPQPKGPPKRDFLKENVMKIKKASEKNREQVKQQDKQRTLKIKTIKKPPNTFQTASCDTLVSCNSCSRPLSQQSTQTADQGMQTVDDLNSEAFLKNSIIKYPSNTMLAEQNRAQEDDKKCGEGDCSECNTHISNLQQFLDTGSITKKSNYSEQSSQRSASSRSYREGPKTPKFKMPPHILSPRSDFSSRNHNFSGDTSNASQPLSPTSTVDTMTSNLSRLKKNEENKNDVPLNYKKGELPKYLQNRKENIIKEQERLKEIDPECPPDHIVLSEEERKETLDLAEKKFQSFVDELNKMPMTADTLKIRRRKIEIEKELDTLESTIRIFSRLKVYVKIDQ